MRCVPHNYRFKKMYRVSKSSTMVCGVSSPPSWDFQLQPPPEGTWHTCGAPLPSSTHLGPDSRSFHVYLDSQNPLGSCELAHRRDLRQGQLEGRAISSRCFTHVDYFFSFWHVYVVYMCVCVRTQKIKTGVECLSYLLSTVFIKARSLVGHGARQLLIAERAGLPQRSLGSATFLSVVIKRATAQFSCGTETLTLTLM